MVALNEELSGIAEEPQARSGCGAAEGAMTFPPKNRSNPRSIPYCSDSYLPDSDFSRHYARSRNYSPSIGRSISQDPLQFINGANTYQFVMSNPVGNVDPAGLVSLPPGFVGAPPPSPPPSGSLWPASPPTGGFSGTWWYPVSLPGGTIDLTGGAGGSLGQNGGYGTNGLGVLKFPIPPLIPYIPNSSWSVCVIGSGTGTGPHGQVQRTGFVVIKVKF